MNSKYNSSFKRYTTSYIKKHPHEKKQIIQSHLKRLELGEQVWNKWAEKFKDHIDSNGITDAHIDFTDTEIRHEKFHKINFPATTSFNRSTFPTDVTFYNSTFSENVFFVGVIFSGITAFEGTWFKKLADFSQAIFFRTAFDNLKFFSYVEFRRSHFSSDTIFRDVEFFGVADFRQAIFSKFTRFNNTNFSRTAEFSQTMFHHEISFTKVVFSADIFFLGVSFNEKPRFSGITLSTKEQLTQLQNHLTDEMLETFKILDESEINDLNIDHLTGFTLRIQPSHISAINLFYLIKGITATYNNYYYLAHTDESDINEIKQQVLSTYKAIASSNELYFSSVQPGSTIFSLKGVDKIIPGIINAITDVYVKVSEITIKKEQLKIEKQRVKLEEIQIMQQLKHNENNETRLQESHDQKLVAGQLSNVGNFLDVSRNLLALELEKTTNEVILLIDADNIVDGLSEPNSETVKENYSELVRLSSKHLVQSITKNIENGSKIEVSQ